MAKKRKGPEGGLLVGPKHTQGGIPVINKGTGQPLEVEGGEVIITAPAVDDNTKREFNGRMMTNRQILSAINQSGGGVAFAKGGDVPDSILCTGKRYKYGGKMMRDHEIVSDCGCQHSFKKGGSIKTLEPQREKLRAIVRKYYPDPESGNWEDRPESPRRFFSTDEHIFPPDETKEENAKRFIKFNAALKNAGLYKYTMLGLSRDGTGIFSVRFRPKYEQETKPIREKLRAIVKKYWKDPYNANWEDTPFKRFSNAEIIDNPIDENESEEQLWQKTLQDIKNAGIYPYVDHSQSSKRSFMLSVPHWGYSKGGTTPSKKLHLRQADYLLQEKHTDFHKTKELMAHGGIAGKYPSMEAPLTSQSVNESATLFDVPEKPSNKLTLKPLKKPLQEINITLKTTPLLVDKKIYGADDASKVFMQLWDKDSINIIERCYVLFLNRQNQPIGFYEMSKGGTSATIIDPGIIAALAVKSLAAGVMLAHNHPSGSILPSSADVQMTRTTKDALKLVNVRLLDHLIMTPNGDYYSFGNSGDLSYAKGGTIAAAPANPLTKKYANAFELNKAIEQLLDSHPDGCTECFSAEEKQFLKYYSGYGGLEKYGAEGKGLLYEYFTPALIAEKMWGLAFQNGYNGGDFLEPSSGIGEFIKYAPDQSRCTAYEINKYSARICKILYPKINIENKYFEELFIINRDTIKNKTNGLKKYKLVIGNPPYGEFLGRFAGMGEKAYTRAGNYIDYFIFRGLDLLEPEGLLIFVVGAEVASGGKPFLSQQMNSCKQEIIAKADLVDAYRLPNGVFERTDVLTDIIVLKKK